MKKLLSLLLCVIFCTCVTSCAFSGEDAGNKERTVSEVEDEYYEKVGDCYDLLDEICNAIKDDMLLSSFDTAKSRQEDKIKELDELDAEVKALYKELIPMEDEEMKEQVEKLHSAYLELYQAVIFPDEKDTGDGDSYYLSTFSQFTSFLTQNSLMAGLRLERSVK